MRGVMHTASFASDWRVRRSTNARVGFGYRDAPTTSVRITLSVLVVEVFLRAHNTNNLDHIQTVCL